MNKTYIIGEIGQNHNGSVDIAKLIIELICRPVKEDVFGMDLSPMDAVKMTRRDLNEELTVSQMKRPYDTPNSFGATYGEHRAFLELMMMLIMRCINMLNPKAWILSRHFVPRDVYRF